MTRYEEEVMLRDGWDQGGGGRRTGVEATRRRGLWIDLSCVAAEASLKSEFLVLQHSFYDMFRC